jgi:hypothetical protein
MEAQMERLIFLKKNQKQRCKEETRRGGKGQVIFCFKFFEEKTLNPF